jgi:hypothetical protein
MEVEHEMWRILDQRHAESRLIKDWLEIEAGVSMLFSSGRSEWDADLLFKKPFALSDKLEFMVGTPSTI